MNIRTSCKGFTLIEIMVVVSIISLLSAFLFTSFKEARVNSVNKSVKSELKEVQLAIELYKAQNGNYPPAQDNPYASEDCVYTLNGVDIADSDFCGDYYPIIDVLAPDFIDELPDSDDSKNPDCHYLYMVESTDYSWYKLIAENCYADATEASDGVQSDDVLARCPSTCPSLDDCDPSVSNFYQSYAIYSQGGECQNP